LKDLLYIIFPCRLYSAIEKNEFNLNEQLLDCCPASTEIIHRNVGINWKGDILELRPSTNFAQIYFETVCLMSVKDQPCRFLAKQYENRSRCVQRYQYVSTMGRTYGHQDEPFRIQYIRIASGCNCNVQTFSHSTATDYIY